VDVVDEMFEATGAVVMGRRTFDLGDKENGWIADPPFQVPMFIPTHHRPHHPTDHAASTVTFVTNGIDSAVERARLAAGDRNVLVCGARTGQQCLRAGHLDELEIHLVPVLLGDGIRLFEPGTDQIELEPVRTIEAPGVTHMRFRVVST
jgi:dihydrofolate reductase